MSGEMIERRFREVGVPLRVSEGRWFRLDVGRDRRRSPEWIALNPGDASVQVMDADRAHQQVLLLVKDTDGRRRPTTRKFLCGRDERSLFVIGVPNRFGVAVNTVAAAHEALKPELVREAEAAKARGRERGPAWVRQGDWFFVPYPWIPLDRVGTRRVKLGFGNPHIVDYLTGNTGSLYRGWGRVEPEGPVFARGFVRHRQHKPLNLRVWHRVVPNTAVQAPGGYLD